ncbi:hypothetical protein V6N13_039581 [Hibiscus sabdariffa]
MDLTEWLRVNLAVFVAFAHVIENWDLAFGYILRNLWLRRNAIAFNKPLFIQGNVIERARLMVTNTINSGGLARATLVSGVRLTAETE